MMMTIISVQIFCNMTAREKKDFKKHLSDELELVNKTHDRVNDVECGSLPFHARISKIEFLHV